MDKDERVLDRREDRTKEDGRREKQRKVLGRKEGCRVRKHNNKNRREKGKGRIHR